ncbi:MAG: FprA family A-type flavoprotein [Candidatus Enterosoma sp.]|nr:FprA family A-type flavoprotein [Bacilli bacterium]MDY5649526.1 FprA family A-type flavoprotein [Candidatus Enterosoma sp.]
MKNIRKVTEDVIYVGADDRKLDLFEGHLPISYGVSYNSYLITDEKTCLMDTADSSVTRQFIENVQGALDGRKLDYLVVLHMEPDHCYNIEQIVLRHPECQVVGNEKTFDFIANFFPNLDLEGKKVVVSEGDVLDLGKHKLKFIFAPMVHWPEVMIAYDVTSQLLFSADAFGMFGALDGNLFADNVDFDRDHLDEARRYYTNIVGKYGMQVLSLFKKVEGVPLKMILPLHGYIWRDNFSYILNKYTLWASYTPEVKSVLIVYGTMYGDNACVANTLANKLSENGVKDIRVYDASVVSSSVLLSDSFKYSNIVIISPTYNMTIYPDIEEYLTDILRMGLRNRKISIIENGSWAPNVKNLIKAKIENSKLPFEFLKTELTVRSSLKEEDEKILNQMALEIKESLDR